MNSKAKRFIGAVTITGFAAGVCGIMPWNFPDPVRFATFLLLAIASSGLRVSLPSIPGTLSAVFVFQFISIIQMTLPEALVIAWCAALSQNFWMAKKRPTAAQATFNVATVSMSVQLAYYVYRFFEHLLGEWGMLIGLLSSSMVAYLVNTVAVATVIALLNQKSPVDTWRSNYFWSFPYYLAGAALAGLLSVASSSFGWQTSLLILPVVFLFYRSYTTYTGRLEDAKNHAEEVSALHLRTIESLALAIEAKDDTTHAHLRRVQTYALALGEDLGLTTTELAALRAAAILHDIGKLAVPEHIICKPGKLTPEEFEKMKIHPVVGAEILEHVKFPYPVAPIVLSHHEKWNGTGYPNGLAEENIPLGARILAVVDCLDALASDRQYRKALPIQEAMNVVRAEKGKSFDPKIVDLLDARYLELEQKAQAACVDIVKLSTNLKVERGDAPAAGFEESAPLHVSRPVDGGVAAEPAPLTHQIAEVRHEVQAAFHLSATLDGTLSLPETLSLVAHRLKPFIPHDSMVIWTRSNQMLEAFYVHGVNQGLFESLQITLGEGLAGWVAENDKPIVNGNPAVEPGYANDASRFVTLRSALAIPLNGVAGFSGVLAFYKAGKDAYNKDHMRVLQGVSSKLAVCLEQSILAAGARDNAALARATAEEEPAERPVVSRDGLPGIERLFERFEAEIERSKRSGSTLGVLMCDIDELGLVNARFGTPAGDRLLREFGAGLRDMFREYDLVAHLGGDEFAVLIPEIQPENLQSRIRQIHLLAMQTGHDVCSEDTLSITIGDACYPKDGASVEELINHADRRLSLAKRQKYAARTAASPAKNNNTTPAATAPTSAETPTAPVGV